MLLLIPSGRRKEGGEQPYIRLGIFKLRLPFIHFEWEIPETIQAMVVFVTGVAATAYLQDLYGLPWATALAIICVHELLYCLQNLLGDPIVGGWITPSIPLTTAFLLTYTGVARVEALLSLQLTLGILFLILGVTGIAGKLVAMTPNSVKAGILIGAGIASVIGRYGFTTLAGGGLGFYKYPFAFTTGVLVSFFLLFSKGFKEAKESKGNFFINIMAKSGFVPGLLAAFAVGIIAGEIDAPVFAADSGWFFNPLGPEGLPWVWKNFSIIGLGIPPMSVLMSAIPMALIAYVIAFGDIVAGTEFLRDADRVRQDEIIEVDANRTNVMCGLRNVLQSLFFPTVTMSGPLWSAMCLSVAERYKTGKENMYSIWGGASTFNIVKFLCCLVIPLTALIRPVLPLSMALTLMIQAFGCFYVAFNMVSDNEERGVAGVVGSILAVAGPAAGLAAGIVIAIVVQFLAAKRKKKEVEGAAA
ncbi:MAG: hypothetical protein LBS00_06065 [Synergistaceae bacterium]|jgi:hypothetical protein|nr:hypothetical protein [Synergistaceae bacterium]